MKVFSTGFQSVLQLVSDPKFRNLAYWLFTHLSLIDWQQFASLSLVDHSFVGFWLADRSFAGRSICGWLQPVQLWCDVMIIKIITSIMFMILKVITSIIHHHLLHHLHHHQWPIIHLPEGQSADDCNGCNFDGGCLLPNKSTHPALTYDKKYKKTKYKKTI